MNREVQNLIEKVTKENKAQQKAIDASEKTAEEHKVTIELQQRELHDLKANIKDFETKTNDQQQAIDQLQSIINNQKETIKVCESIMKHQEMTLKIHDNSIKHFRRAFGSLNLTKRQEHTSKDKTNNKGFEEPDVLVTKENAFNSSKDLKYVRSGIESTNKRKLSRASAPQSKFWMYTLGFLS